MPADVGSVVHPWYKGVHEWVVKKVAKLDKLIEYHDVKQGHVKYEPKIMLLGSPKGEVLWFPYWISTKKTKGKMKWGQRPAMLEEKTFLDLMAEAIKRDMFSNRFLRKLAEETRAKLAH